MKINLRCTIAVIALFMLQSAAKPQAQDITPISLIQLIATPDKFEGRIISVVGFLQMTREADYLYVSELDYKNVISPNSVLVERSEAMGKDRLKLTLKYVRVVGIVHIKNIGNKRPNISVERVSTCELWSDPEHPLIDRVKELTHGKD
jgi:hypothetical protein